VLVQQTRLFAVNAKEVVGHVEGVVRGRHVKAHGGELDGDNLVERGRVESGVLSVLREAHVALHDGFGGGGNHLGSGFAVDSSIQQTRSKREM